MPATASIACGSCRRLQQLLMPVVMLMVATSTLRSVCMSGSENCQHPHAPCTDQFSAVELQEQARIQSPQEDVLMLLSSSICLQYRQEVPIAVFQGSLLRMSGLRETDRTALSYFPVGTSQSRSERRLRR
mmetsp:Transcript_548/g.979  ORF Transcript_548/g.979 Transcript_548/m.979 type:complete len:130 (-) Transcript_548:794-1183(-)